MTKEKPDTPYRHCFSRKNYVVTPERLELSRLATSDPKSDLATNYNRGPILYFG